MRASAVVADPDLQAVLKFILTSGAGGGTPPAIPPLDGCQPQEVIADRGDAADVTAHIEGRLRAPTTTWSTRNGP